MATRVVKREPLATMNIDTAAVPAEKRPPAKRGRDADNRTADQPSDTAESNQQAPAKRGGDSGNRAADEASDTPELNQQASMGRRILRSRYLAVKNLITDRKEDLCRTDSEKFNNLIEEVEDLHKQVQKPREQVADAEALLDIASTFVTSVRSQSKDGITPTDFITCLLRDFGQTARSGNEERVSINWTSIGLFVSSIFKKAHGCCTMIGPMNAELKQRKVAIHKKRTKRTEGASRPEALHDTGEEKTDTDKNMATMFQILKRDKRVRLENLIVNRKSFAQTVENLFALSFLVKDGRAEVAVNEKGTHLVSPRNAPSANSVASGEVVYSHFVFKFNFKDWKLIIDNVPVGEELMPHREQSSMPYSQA
ncbi:hypothetical protein Dimus_021395 [Dionaea muscipula]